MSIHNMPVDQRNARPAPGLVMRVGLPHRGGKLAFHAFNNDYPVMVSANAFWNPATRRFHFPQASDIEELDFAVDSAGFTAMKLWQSKGPQQGIAGIFPWSYAQYIEFATSIGAAWWAQPDLCCEPEIARNQDEIDYRVDATATLLEGTLRVVHQWQAELAKTCSQRVVMNLLQPPVPVIQGWSASDYLRSLDLLLQVWERWRPWYAPPALIGIGSVCRRSLHHPTHGLFAILAALEGHLPAGARLHMFGVKGNALSELKMFDFVASADSMAYDFGARMTARKRGASNSIAHRSAEMSRWMAAAQERLRPSAGDQLRLSFTTDQ
ncbi:deazapurine DNA modification protein DpdA family protein [Burkholderia thailandensis]|uniref:deazapurine DNA modification protein DpdA family protein n=1 Tax=Burkholderia thailandensis TaxID=57975 RepID=UPI00217CFF74|nr:hypothetical protein [Burkholderia thailandensis]MCS6428058.1 hypothetical protein [Burkholderia thailandensis]MCS6467242.1 hypothetical protein [Burkholderia thailandensis]